MVIFTAGGLTFYKLVRMTIIGQIDTSLVTERKIIDDSIPDFTTVFGHQIEVAVYENRFNPSQKIQDTVIANPLGDASAEYRLLVAKDNMEDGRGVTGSAFINRWKIPISLSRTFSWSFAWCLSHCHLS
jgi:hypothetical protein